MPCRSTFEFKIMSKKGRREVIEAKTAKMRGSRWPMKQESCSQPVDWLTGEGFEEPTIPHSQEPPQLGSENQKQQRCGLCSELGHKEPTCLARKSQLFQPLVFSFVQKELSLLFHAQDDCSREIVTTPRCLVSLVEFMALRPTKEAYSTTLLRRRIVLGINLATPDVSSLSITHSAVSVRKNAIFTPQHLSIKEYEPYDNIKALEKRILTGLGLLPTELADSTARILDVPSALWLLILAAKSKGIAIPDNLHVCVSLDGFLVSRKLRKLEKNFNSSDPLAATAAKLAHLRLSEQSTVAATIWIANMPRHYIYTDSNIALIGLSHCSDSVALTEKTFAAALEVKQVNRFKVTWFPLGDGIEQADWAKLRAFTSRNPSFFSTVCKECMKKMDPGPHRCWEDLNLFTVDDVIQHSPVPVAEHLHESLRKEIIAIHGGHYANPILSVELVSNLNSDVLHTPMNAGKMLSKVFSKECRNLDAELFSSLFFAFGVDASCTAWVQEAHFASREKSSHKNFSCKQAREFFGIMPFVMFDFATQMEAFLEEGAQASPPNSVFLCHRCLCVSNSEKCTTCGSELSSENNLFATPEARAKLVSNSRPRASPQNYFFLFKWLTLLSLVNIIDVICLQPYLDDNEAKILLENLPHLPSNADIPLTVFENETATKLIHLAKTAAHLSIRLIRGCFVFAKEMTAMGYDFLFFIPLQIEKQYTVYKRGLDAMHSSERKNGKADKLYSSHSSFGVTGAASAYSQVLTAALAEPLLALLSPSHSRAHVAVKGGKRRTLDLKIQKFQDLFAFLNDEDLSRASAWIQKGVPSNWTPPSSGYCNHVGKNWLRAKAPACVEELLLDFLDMKETGPRDPILTDQARQALQKEKRIIHCSTCHRKKANHICPGSYSPLDPLANHEHAAAAFATSRNASRSFL